MTKMTARAKQNQRGKSPKKSWYAKLSFKKRMSLWGFLFLVPWIIGILVFFMGPMIKTFYYSFFNMTLATDGFEFEFIGLANFKQALTVDPDFNKNIVEALTFVVFNVPIQIFVSLFVAMLLNSKYPGRGFFRLIFFIPIILATGILEINLGYSVGADMVKEEGMVLVDSSWLVNILTNGSFPTEIMTPIIQYVNMIFSIITTSGIQMLIFLAGLQAIPSSLYEVAKIEGCSGFESFCKITLPMISPMILVCLIYSLADAFARADVMETIQNVTFTNAKYGLGAAMSAIYLLVSVVVILLVSLIVSRGVFYYDK